MILWMPKTTPKRKDLLSSGQAAEYLGFHVSSINEWADKGLLQLAEKTPGGWRRFAKEELDRFAASLEGKS
jgi:excisionase family DNA binding protein